MQPRRLESVTSSPIPHCVIYVRGEEGIAWNVNDRWALETSRRSVGTDDSAGEDQIDILLCMDCIMHSTRFAANWFDWLRVDEAC